MVPRDLTCATRLDRKIPYLVTYTDRLIRVLALGSSCYLVRMTAGFLTSGYAFSGLERALRSPQSLRETSTMLFARFLLPPQCRVSLAALPVLPDGLSLCSRGLLVSGLAPGSCPFRVRVSKASQSRALNARPPSLLSIKHLIYFKDFSQVRPPFFLSIK